MAGWAGAWRTQPNLRAHVVISVIVLILGGGMHWSATPLSAVDWVALLLCIGMVISLEMINTAIEATVDLLSPQPHPLAKLAKDAAAGAVLWSAIISVAVGGIIFGPRLTEIGPRLIELIRP